MKKRPSLLLFPQVDLTCSSTTYNPIQIPAWPSNYSLIKMETTFPFLGSTNKMNTLKYPAQQTFMAISIL